MTRFGVTTCTDERHGTVVEISGRTRIARNETLLQRDYRCDETTSILTNSL